MNPTLNFQVGNVASLPMMEQSVRCQQLEIENVVSSLIGLARADWNFFENAWNFQTDPLLKEFSDPTSSLESSYAYWVNNNRDVIIETKSLEEENNRLFIDAYGLSDELTPEVPVEQITLTVNPASRYRWRTY